MIIFSTGISRSYIQQTQPATKVALNHRSEELAEELSPPRPAGVTGPLLVNSLPVNLTTTRVNVDLSKRLPDRALPQPTAGVEQADDEESEVRLEERLSRVVCDGAVDGDVELCNEHDYDQTKTDPGSCNTENSGERNLVDGVAVVRPRPPEADVGEANAAPSEERSETGKGLEPIESDRTTSGKGHKSQRRPGDDEDGRPQRTTGAVDVGEESGSVALLSKRGECARATVDTRKTDRHDRQHNDDVGEVGEADNTGAFGDDDERGGFDVDHAATAQEVGVVVRNEQTNEGEGEDVEKSDAPEDLLDRRRQCLGGVLGFGCSQTNELSAGEGEGCSNEYTAESDKAGESTRILPVCSSFVLGIPIPVVSIERYSRCRIVTYSPPAGPPPQTKMTPMNKKQMIVVNFMRETQNSSSAYPRTPNKLMMMIAIMKTTIQTARCTDCAPSHHWTVRPATTSSRGRTIA